jgi:hypothetical protein
MSLWAKLCRTPAATASIPSSNEPFLFSTTPRHFTIGLHAEHYWLPACCIADCQSARLKNSTRVRKFQSPLIPNPSDQIRLIPTNSNLKNIFSG